MITDEQLEELNTFGFCHFHGGKDELYKFARRVIALAQEVPPLSWRTISGYHSALGLNSLYRVVPTDDKYSLVCIAGDAAVSKVISSVINTIEEAERIANEHNRKRILSRLKYGESND